VNNIQRQRLTAVLDSAQAITLKARKNDITVDAFGLAWVSSWHIVGKVDEVEQTLQLSAYEPQS
jgi:hypothetical protein